jgi:tRNA nucleotidyltransferase/poly(A) polymerase
MLGVRTTLAVLLPTASIAARARTMSTTVEQPAALGVPLPADAHRRFLTFLTPSLLRVVRLLELANGSARLVGGAVRDIVDGSKVPSDIDIATDLTPETIMSAVTLGAVGSEGITAVPTGLQHGTVTLVVDHRDAFEVTTLRIDTDTDGRRANVVFTNDWRQDALRRDLTVNAMSLDMQGHLYDYFGGREDLAAGRCRFVGSAADRIREDYLRILRYFRFHGRISRGAGHEGETMDAIVANLDGLAIISGERIWMEMGQILGHASAPLELPVMAERGVLRALRLPEVSSTALETFLRVCPWSTDPLTRLSALLPTTEAAEEMCTAWKLSNKHRLQLLLTVAHAGCAPGPDALDWGKAQLTLRVPPPVHSVAEVLRFHGRVDQAAALEAWTVPVFPVHGGGMTAAGVRPGPRMGELLEQLRERWVQSRFTLTEAQLLGEVLPTLMTEADRSDTARAAGGRKGKRA